jgi:hypothetical protein
MKITIPLQIIDLHEDGFHLLVEAVVFGQNFKLVLDTGASKTVFDQAWLKEIEPDITIEESSRLSTGLGTNDMASFTTLISDLQIGELQVPPFRVAVLDLSTINYAYEQLNHPRVLGVLGSDLLMNYKAIIDYGEQRLLMNKVN